MSWDRNQMLIGLNGLKKTLILDGKMNLKRMRKLKLFQHVLADMLNFIPIIDNYLLFMLMLG